LFWSNPPIKQSLSPTRSFASAKLQSPHISGGELLGTVNVSPNTFGLYISEIVSEFVRMGFENVIILLGHAGTDNINALRNSLQMLLCRNKKKICLSLVEVWTLSPTWLSGFTLEPEHDFHAGMMETAMMMYWRETDI